MARVRTAKGPNPAEPENMSLEETTRAGFPPVTKSAAARAAIDEGYELPREAAAYIKKTFGIDMSPQHFSAVKSQVKKREADGTPMGKRGRKPKAASQAVDGYMAPPPKRRSDGEGDLIDSLETLKPLIAQYGADTVKRLVDLLG